MAQGQSRIQSFFTFALWITVIATSTWGGLSWGAGRSQYFGPTPEALTHAAFLWSLMFSPWVLLFLLPSSLKRKLLTLAVMLSISIAIPEVFCSLQELSFRSRYHDRSTVEGAVVENRWWPFTNHHIFYDPGRRYWGGGC